MADDGEIQVDSANVQQKYAIRKILAARGTSSVPQFLREIRNALSVQAAGPLDARLAKRALDAIMPHAKCADDAVEETEQITHDALWALTNLAACSTEACVAIVADAHFFPDLITRHMAAPHRPQLLDQALWLVGNLLLDNATHDAVVKAGVGRAIADCAWATLGMSIEVVRTCAWALAALFEGTHKEVERGALPAVKLLLVSVADEETLQDLGGAVWRWLKHWDDDEREHVDALIIHDEDDASIDFDIAVRIVSMLHDEDLADIGLKIVSHLLSMDDWCLMYVDILLGDGLLDGLAHVLRRAGEIAAPAKRYTAQKDVLWALSNLVAGSSWHCRLTMEHGEIMHAIPPFFDRMDAIGREAAFFVTNLFVGRRADDVWEFMPTENALPIAWAIRCVRTHRGRWWADAVALAVGAVRDLSHSALEQPGPGEEREDGEGRPLSLVAAESGKIEVMEWLVDKLPHLAAVASARTGRTPLGAAAAHRNIKVAQMLLERTRVADEPPEVLPKHRALYAAANARNRGLPNLVNLLLQNGFTLGATDAATTLSTEGEGRLLRFCALYTTEWTPLHRAVAHRDLEATRRALRDGYYLEDVTTSKVDDAACREIVVETAEFFPTRDTIAVITRTVPRLFIGSLQLVAIEESVQRNELQLVSMQQQEDEHGTRRFRLFLKSANGREMPESLPLLMTALRPANYREFPCTVSVIARTEKYPYALPVNDEIVKVIDQAQAPWSVETNNLFPRAARERVCVVMQCLQYKIRLAGSARPGLDDLWLRILAFAIDRDDD